MIRLGWLAGLIGYLGVAIGSASAYDETPKKSVEKANGPTDSVDRHEVTPIVPYANACQDKDYAPNCLGRVAHWFMYRPECSCTPCDAKYSSGCYPPLFTYFSASPFNRRYKSYECCEADKPWCTRWFNRCWGRDKCCENEKCGTSCDAKGSWSLSITFPSISFSRGGEVCEECPAPKRERACVTPKCEKACPAPACTTCPPAKDRCMLLPRPISAKACENSSAGCPPKKECKKECGTECCEEPCRPRIFSGRLLGFFSTGCGVGGCGGCGYGKQCCTTPVHSPVDFEHMPIMSPNEIKDVKPGGFKNPPPTSAEPAPAVMPAVGEPLPAPSSSSPVPAATPGK